MPKAKVNGINIDYRLSGQGEPLVMITGTASTQDSWLFQTPVFKKHYRVVIFDNRGAGRSDRPIGPYSIKMMADDTVGLMNHLGIEKAHILGHSMGGMIAQELAINYPERVLRLVLASTFARRDEANGFSSELSQALRYLGYDERHSDSDIGNIPNRKAVNALYGLFFNNRLYRTIFIALMKLRVRRVKGTVRIMEQFEAVLGHNTADRLQLVNAPTLVITGSKDRVFKPGSSELIAELIPDARLVRIDNGSHIFFVEMRNKFNKEVLDFLKGA